MGASPVTWQELQAWQNATGLELEVWELRAIKRASMAYAEQLSLSNKADCPPPEKVIEHEPQRLKNHIKNILRG